MSLLALLDGSTADKISDLQLISNYSEFGQHSNEHREDHLLHFT